MLLMCAIAVIAYLQRSSIAVAIRPIGDEFTLDLVERTSLLGAFYWGYLIFQIPTGWLTDIWGTRRTLAGMAAAWSIALAALPLTDDLFSAWWLWFAIGGLQSFVFTGATRGMREWLPDATWARANGMLTSSMFLGGGISTALTAQLLLGFTWRAVYVLYGSIGVAWAVLFFTWYRKPPAVEILLSASNEAELINRTDERPAVQSRVTMLALLCLPSMWLLLGQQVFRNAPHVFFSSLFPTFLQEHHHLELLDSGRLTSVPLFATLAGCMASGFAVDLIYQQTADRSASRRIAAVFGLALAGVAVIASLWTSDPLGATLVMSVGAFGSAFGGVASFTIAMDIGGERTGTVFGLMNTAGNLGAAVAPQMLGEVVARSSWIVAVVVCGVMYLLAALCWLGVRAGGGSRRVSAEGEGFAAADATASR